MNTILITGASGFLGGFLVDEFLNHGFKVRAMVREGSDLSHLKKTNAEIVFADITNYIQVENALEGISQVIHAAAILGVGGRREEDFLKINYEATKNLALSCIKKSVKRLTFISSIAAVGPTTDKNCLLNENSPFNANGFYGKSKQEAEKYLLSDEIDKKKLEIVIIRPALIYGPRDKRCAANYFRIANLGFFPLPMPSDNKASFIYISDAAKAIFLAHTKSPSNEIYMLAGEVATFRAFGEKLLSTKNSGLSLLIPIPRFLINIIASLAGPIFRIMGKSADIGKRIKNIGTGNWAVDNSKIRKMLGFTPRVYLKEGLEKTWNFYSKNKELLHIKYLLKNP